MAGVRVLITGGAGFIGSHLAAHELARGNNVHVLVRPTTTLNRLARLNGDLNVHHCDLADAAALADCFAAARPERVFHLGVRTRRPPEPNIDQAIDSVREDLLNTLTLLKAAAEAPVPPKILVRAGTIAAYGDLPPPFEECQRERPLTAYGAAMVAGAHYSNLLQPCLPFQVVTARLALVYGFGQSTAFLVPSMIEKCLAGQPVVLRNPDARRDLIYVDDVVEGLSLVARKGLPADQPIINLATGIAPSVREMADVVVRATGCDPDLIRVAPTPGVGDTVLVSSPDLARDLLGWTSKTRFSDGIARTVELIRASELMSEAAE